MHDTEAVVSPRPAPLTAISSPLMTKTHAGTRIAPAARPGRTAEGWVEVCHIVTAERPDLALCGRDVSGYPWDPPWPPCEACLAVVDGRMS